MQIKSNRIHGFALLFILSSVFFAMLSAVSPANAQTYSVLHNFGVSPEPVSPQGLLAQGGDGALYGISVTGGANSRGTVYKISPNGIMRVIYNFCAQAKCVDGSVPRGGLTLRPNGHFIGTTELGGSFGHGTIFDITQTGTLTVLYSFTGGTDGTDPWAAPVWGADGSFYGTTFGGGGTSKCGTIYKITNSGAAPGGFKLLYDFDGTHGCGPVSALVLGADGNLYGQASEGGSSGDGVIFQVTTAGNVTVLHNFDGKDGDTPVSALILGSDGNFYGSTRGNIVHATIFQFTPTGTLTVLHILNGTTDGSQPYGITQATDGNLYGIANQGGTSTNCSFGCGTLFQVTPTGNYSVLYNFDNTTGSIPLTTPFQHTNGIIYGDTDFGGSGLCTGTPPGCGVFYSWSANLTPYAALIPFLGKVGSTIEILGQGFDSATTVSFNGTPATVKVTNATRLLATVPSGATTGLVTVTTSSGTLTSNKQFVVTP